MDFFSSVKLIKTMRLTPSNRLFACVVRVLWPIWISSKIGSIRSVPTLTWKISRSRIFPKKLIVQTEREKLTAPTNIMTSVTRILTKLFFHFFQTWNFFVFIYFWTYQVDFYGFGIDFYQIWDVFNLYKPVLGAFFDVSTHFHVFYVWTRNGPKMRFQNMVLKGLIWL